MRTSLAIRLAALAAAVLAGCGRPIVVHAVTGPADDPVPDVRVYRHRFGFLNFFPGRRFVETGPDGRAEVSVGSANTNLTFLRSGYEPVIFGVFETPSAAIAPDAGGYDHVVMYRDVRAAPDNEYQVQLRPVRCVPIEIAAVDRAGGAAVPGVHVYAATFLYLPQPGLEADWGFPPLQDAVTGADGRATVDQVSGFRNRITVRGAGFQDAVIDVDGRDLGVARSVDVPMRRLSTKRIDFLVVDAESKRPVAGATVRQGEARDGLPPNPNGWSRTSGADGRTGPVPLPDLEPGLLLVSRDGYQEWRGAPVWRALVEGQTKRIELRRK